MRVTALPSDALLLERMARENVPGAVIATLKAGKITEVRYLGVHDRAGNPVTADTRFECASLTKPVFAALTLRLLGRGAPDLDAPLSRLPGKSWCKDPRFAAVTPRQILSHASGLPNWEKAPMQLKFTPGEGFSYSGEGYFLLQRHLEQRLNTDLHTLARREIFEALKLNMALCWTPEIGAAFAEGFDREGSVRKVRSERRTKGLAPEPNAAWSLYANAGDYAAFLSALLHGRILNEETLAEMTRAQNRATPYVHWGLGVGLTDRDANVFWHWGDNSGFKSFFAADRASGDALAVTTNADSGLDFALSLAEDVTTADFINDLRDFIAHAE